jgi:hypothetical protein
VTTIFATRVGRSVVSAITQTPASGPPGPVTTPAMSARPGVTPAAARCPRMVADAVNRRATPASIVTARRVLI